MHMPCSFNTQRRHIAMVDDFTAVASYACTEHRRTKQANQSTKFDGCKAHRPCTDMLSASRQRRAGSGARGGRRARRQEFASDRSESELRQVDTALYKPPLPISHVRAPKSPSRGQELRT